MKNENILPGQLVPKEIRHEVYKEALEIVKNFNRNYRLIKPHLCLVLPCILWGLSHYLRNSPIGCLWDETSTPLMFPEINGIVEDIDIAIDDHEANKIRIQYLENAINATKP